MKDASGLSLPAMRQIWFDELATSWEEQDERIAESIKRDKEIAEEFSNIE
jgi:hypothetical protein